MNLDALNDQELVMAAYKPQTKEEAEIAEQASKLMEDGASKIKEPPHNDEASECGYHQLEKG